MKTIEELQADLSGLLDEAQALVDLSAEGDLTEDQQERFDSLTADDGEIAAAKDKLAKGEAYRAKLDAIKASRAELSAKAPVIGRGVEAPKAEAEPFPEASVRSTRRQFFDSDREAHLAGLWFSGSAARSEDHRTQVKSELQRLGGEKWARFAAQSIGTDGKGGYTVPEPIASEILKYRDEVGVANRLARVTPMTTETLRFNEQTAGTTVYYPAESTAITPSDVTWAQNTLTVTARGVLVRMSREFLMDSNIAAANEIVSDIAYELAYKMDDELINGDGTSTYGSETGLITALGSAGTVTAASGVDTIAELDLQDFVDLKKKLPHKFQRGASWFFSPDAWYQVESLLLAAGGAATPEFVAGLSDSPRFMGRPVVVSDLFPAEAASAFVAFYGDFGRSVRIGDRNDMEIATSDQRYWETGDVGIRAFHRYDILVHNAGDGSNAGGYVGLQLAAS